MDKIVDKACKVDFHIHSCASAGVDTDVGNLNDKNIGVLINKLNDNGVNICSFSDHNAFSFHMYKTLKEEEGKGSIKKVLPAVEFSVGIVENAHHGGIHIITIFNDNDDDKLKHLESMLTPGSSDYIEFNGDGCYTQENYLKILSKTGLDCICIAHQKSTVESNGKPDNRSVTSEGKLVFEECVLMEYFEAYEFRNKRNEVYNNIEMEKFNNQDDDLLRFTTGSDCHNWDFYPHSNIDQQSNNLFMFTYLKCLPNFKGVALALSDKTRISYSDNFFTTSTNFLESIHLKIRDQEYDIPLSKGINAIIGDNSIGKSLLLHKMTDYRYISRDKKNTEGGYKSFMEQQGLRITTKIDDSSIFKFDPQGGIRDYFVSKTLSLDKIFKYKFPKDIPIDNLRDAITNKLNEFCNNIQAKFKYDSEKNSISTFKIEDITTDTNKNLSLTSIKDDYFSEEQKGNDTICKELNAIQTSITGLIKRKELPLDEDDIPTLNELLESVNKLKKKYDEKAEYIKKKIAYVDKINAAITESINKYTIRKSTLEKEHSGYFTSKNNFISNICDAYKDYIKIKPIDFSFTTAEKQNDERTQFDKYKFIKRIAAKEIDSEYIKNLFLSPLHTGSTGIFDDIYSLTIETFSNSLNKFKEANYSDPIEYYKSCINKQILEDLKMDYNVVKVKDSPNKEYSNGTNIQIYFDIYSSDYSSQGIYIIDQPEDDVSAQAIKKYLLDDFRHMREHRQVILITHNPQFVVNLDADNVIFMHYKDSDESVLDIQSGALEYVDENDKSYNMLDIVANTLEGGVDSIRKRWKYYDKNRD